MRYVLAVAVPIEGGRPAHVQIRVGPLEREKAGANGELITRLGVDPAAKARQPAGLRVVRGEVGGNTEPPKVMAGKGGAGS